MKEIDKLLEAYNLLKDYCEGQKNCEECVFLNPDNGECSIGTEPHEWYFCRYSKDEADLADILQKYGAESIKKINGNVFWKTSDLRGVFCQRECSILLRKMKKYQLRKSQSIQIGSIFQK